MMVAYLLIVGLAACGHEIEVARAAAEAARQTTAQDSTLAARDMAARVDAILEEYEQVRSELSGKLRAANSDKERKLLLLEWFPRPGEYLARLWPVVDSSPSHPAALRALLWAAKQQVPSEDQQRILSLLLEHHSGSKELLDILDRVAPTLAATRFLDALRKDNASRDVRGRATYALAEALDRLADMVRMRGKLASVFDEDMREQIMKEVRLIMGEETLAWVEVADLSSLEGRRQKLLETVAEDYADVKVYGNPLGEKARADLGELRKLAVGSIAPQIEGTDVDGIPFKLSDYRGKVILLDFWGHW